MSWYVFFSLCALSCLVFWAVLLIESQNARVDTFFAIWTVFASFIYTLMCSIYLHTYSFVLSLVTYSGTLLCSWQCWWQPTATYIYIAFMPIDMKFSPKLWCYSMHSNFCGMLNVIYFWTNSSSLFSNQLCRYPVDVFCHLHLWSRITTVCPHYQQA